MDLWELRKEPHLSASSIGDYVECGLLYKLGRIDRVPMEYISSDLEFGTVIHIVLGQYYQEKMIGDRMSLKDIHESFKQHWKKKAKGRTNIKYPDEKDFKTYLMMGVDLLSAWYNKLSDDNFRVIGIEEAFAFELPGLPVPIIGATDLVEEDESETIIVTDFKTSGKAYSIADVDNNQQLTIYQMAAKRNGFEGREILLRFDCLIKTKTPKFEAYWTTRNEIDEKRLVRKIYEVWEGISNEVFVPNDTSWKCKGCAYKKACDEWFLNGGER